MPLSIVSSDGRDGCDPSRATARPADLVVIAGSDSELARYAQAWHGAGRDLPALHMANLRRLTPNQIEQLNTAIAGARGLLIHLPPDIDDRRSDITAMAELARSRNIALAVVGIADQADPALAALSNMPRTTLRRLAALCRRPDARSARAVLTQLSLSAGLSIEPWLDEPAAAVPEPIRGEAR
ncbi:hypothetical protein IP86_14745 [Rhodopseudomonas sp. AAP120]|uniref:hypothetical protein n=1 Tax=Rhodopseudomonas sp. AAP120 TaxID=1523430 RepID=UPI0006B90B7B|nr:hypothetical protein [Rhodopseudomonas sp. AAP120]KPF96990.1 hypothetical protein IP86_14745 [Rhodopseudomonas sp. AAP120]